MSKIANAAAHALEEQTPFKSGHVKVEIGPDGSSRLYYRNNLIAVRHSNKGAIEVSDAGYQTVTTKRYLNAISGVHVVQNDWEWYLNGDPWNGDWKAV